MISESPAMVGPVLLAATSLTPIIFSSAHFATSLTMQIQARLAKRSSGSLAPTKLSSANSLAFLAERRKGTKC